MIQLVYAVYDSKACVFATPFFVNGEAVAVRAFVGAANDPTTQVGRFGEDFTLFQLATYNDESGVIMPLDHHKNLGLASSYRR